MFNGINKKIVDFIKGHNSSHLYNDQVYLFGVDCIDERNIPKSAFHRIEKPSVVTLKDDQQIIKKSDQQLSKWKKSLSEKQVERILKIMSYFGMDFYNVNIEPDYKKINF